MSRLKCQCTLMSWTFLLKFCRLVNCPSLTSTTHLTRYISSQVKTKLENPTRYHVMQKQKTQVRQYLSESFKQTHLGRQANSLGASMMREQVRSNVPKPMEQKSHSLEFGQLHLNSSGTPGSGGANQQFYFPNNSRFSSVTASPSEGNMSPSLASSVVTSGSEVSATCFFFSEHLPQCDN